MGIDIQYLASKVEPRNELTFQSFRIDFLEADTAFGDKGLGKRHFSSHRDFKSLDGLEKVVRVPFQSVV